MFNITTFHTRAAMLNGLRIVFLFTLALAAVTGAVTAVKADGALAIADCGGYGFSYNYDTEAAARERALKECRDHKGKNCKIVVALSGNCAAFSIDDRKACGAWGWASRATKDAAVTAAINECTKAGGADCVKRAEVCDSKAAPAMTTNWSSSTLEQKECIARAETVMKDAKLIKNYEVVNQSVFGEEGDYTAQVRCLTEKKIVIFVVVGPDLEEARKYMAAIYDKF
ncbi:MAG: DUF4189 domain-containing protein [Hyphomicrobiales bacterium]